MIKINDLIFFVLSLVVAAFVYIKGALTLAGYFTAMILALFLFYIGGAHFIIVLLTFFISSTLLSKINKSLKESLEMKISEHTGARTSIQVLANGGPALIMAILFAIYRQPEFVICYCAALAASNADTWASELGVLSRKDPISFISGKPIERGLSGGVTAFGFVASICGAMLIALISSILLFPVKFEIMIVVVSMITLAGLLGSLLDSLLGDILQAKYINLQGDITEKKYSNGKPNKLVKGFAFVNNDLVNFLSSLFAALISLIVIRVSDQSWLYTLRLYNLTDIFLPLF